VSGVLVRRTTLRPADALGEAFTSIVARPLAATATGFGTLLAVGWFVAMLGLVSTASGQVASAFTQRLATTVMVAGPVPTLLDAPFPFPAGVERRVDSLSGIVASGIYWQVRLGRPVVVSSQPAARAATEAGGANEVVPPVIAGTPGYLAAAGVSLSQGRLFDTWDQSHAAGVCLVGSALARSLGISGLSSTHTIYIDNAGCVITGIVSQAVRQPSLLRSVVLPTSTATALFGAPDQLAGARPTVLIATRPGAAGLIARQAPYAINPARPHRLVVSTRPGPTLLRRRVADTLTRLFVAVGWVGLAVGVIAIAGLTTFCVLQRTPEFALRRAVGARRHHIAAQVLAESVILGLLGGLAGASLGVAAVVLIAKAMYWTPVVAPLTLWPAPLIGAAAGMIAGIGPAIRAAWIRPSAGLSRFPPL
jgi:putative ABC transport system permease protein